ncbi:phosphatase PAP2 family protein [Pseudomonas syringae]|uniref:phosphatase PAP2 family protein n=1 Tax=Pseudomonas syringae TaxID=317 RepID=UPI00137296FC|nr:phosphatase PAP2 family protein [Pseudomonas syringae pv. actinidifoliorum]MDU8522546.1 phosphatase PAP2 family protein [Pseudomonas syringae pv. actinidifoliorum]MDU8529202.1 phosphatase PAP2 family protein [Pseudomonas syringae pv. actinidifoliorum]NAS95300.1 PAP2 family protein [Pseudomonas syringae pv. actinidifoliorum]NAT22808.1 PAP2 family protein [Pseudomonas syringae pv. actinidifoliorum]
MQSEKSRFYAWNFGVPIAIALLTFVVFDLTSLDEAISNWLYYPLQVFPFEHDRFFENLTHRWPRIIPDWTGEAAVIGLLLSFIWPLLKPGRNDRMIDLLETARVAPLLRFTARHRRDLLFIVVSFAVITGMIHFFKSHTSIYCPVETTLYGGTMEKKEWFENFSLFHEAGAGRCWPGGHASGGFTMVALYFVARRYCWRHAKAILYASTVLGAIYGTTRVVQGWHFMSHTFWAGVIVWLSALLTALAFYGWRQLAQPLESKKDKPLS